MVHLNDGVDDAFGHWLAGFIDGEGCFQIEPHYTNKSGGLHRGYHCYFSLSVRADDKPIIQTIRDTLGYGKVYDCKRKNPTPNENPAVRWAVMAKGDCLRLVGLLDRYGLRSKKAKDFALWRQAVMEWQGFQQGGNHRRDWTRMEQLYGQLRGARRYDPDAFVPEPERETLTIF